MKEQEIKTLSRWGSLLDGMTEEGRSVLGVVIDGRLIWDTLCLPEIKYRNGRGLNKAILDLMVTLVKEEGILPHEDAQHVVTQFVWRENKRRFSEKLKDEA